MKLSSLALGCLLLVSGQSIACDVCGTALSGSQWGVLPQFRRSLITVRGSYQHNSLRQTSQSAEQYFAPLEISARYYPIPRLQLVASQPILSAFQQISTGEQGQLVGFSDLSLSANYLIFDSSKDSLARDWKQTALIGAGVKAPLGAAQKLSKGGTINPYFQLGSGSWDFPVNAVYTSRFNQYGSNLELSYRFNRLNNNHFRFGDKLSISHRFFYWHRARRFSLLPQAGYLYEQNGKDWHRGQFMNNSGGHSWALTAGLDFYRQSWVLSLNVQAPIRQSLALGEVIRRPSISISISKVL